MNNFNFEKGQGTVEYALVLVLVGVVVVIILALLGGAIGNVFQNIVCNIDPDFCEAVGGMSQEIQ